MEVSQLIRNIILALSSAFGIVSSAACLIYILTKLKLNKYVKAILTISTAYNFLAFVVMFSGLIVFWIEETPNELSCRIILYSWAGTMSIFNFTAMISMLRIYMARLASNTKVIQPATAITFICLGTSLFLPLNPLTILATELFGMKSAIDMCLDRTVESNFPVFESLTSLITTIVLSCGLCCDISLYNFIKNRNQQPVKLIPWKSTNYSTENDLNVPIRATSITSVLLAFIGLTMPIVMLLLINDMNHLLWVIVILCSLCAATLPICLLAFTVKKQQEIVTAQPPAKLHYHADDEEDPELDEPQATVSTEGSGNEEPAAKLHYPSEEDSESEEAQAVLSTTDGRQKVAIFGLEEPVLPNTSIWM